MSKATYRGPVGRRGGAGGLCSRPPHAAARPAQKLKPAHSPNRSNRSGAAVVELAIIAPLLFLLVFGVLEYGRLVMVQQILTNAAREACRQAVVDGATTASVQATALNYLSNASIQGASASVNPDPPSTANPGDPVSVTVSVSFNQVSWLSTPLYLGGRSLSATSTMPMEGAQ